MGVLIVLDTETTGLSPDDAAIVELAACAVRGGKVVDQFSTLVWPGRKYLQPHHRDVLARISGIDPMRLLDEDVPESGEARDLFLEWLGGNLGEGGLMASYNVAFDRRFVEVDPWVLPPIWAPCIMECCTEVMGEAGVLERRRDGAWRWPKLPVACAHFGVPFAETHRALDDARAAAELAIRLGMGG